MMTGDAFRTLALSLSGSSERPHFDRAAFRVRRTFATLAADGASANLCLTREEQEHYVALMPELLAPVPNKFGARGWTTLTLARARQQDVLAPLAAAWRDAGGQDPEAS